MKRVFSTTYGLISIPAYENALSLEVLVAGIHRNFFTSSQKEVSSFRDSSKNLKH